MSFLRTAAEVTRDAAGNVTIRPPPVTLSLSALRAGGEARALRQIVDSLRAMGAKVTLTPEQQAEYDAPRARGG